MKTKLVGTRLGSALMRARNWQSLRGLPLDNPEQASMVANAILADRLVARLCAPDAAFLDIGAHVGSIFSAVHAHVPSAAIHAVEADPGKAAILTQRFPYCALHNVAVGEEERTATFFVDRQRSGYSSLIAQGGQTEEITVPVRRLDDLFPDTAFDLIKIDIEGAELGALRGGTALFARSRPTVLFESTTLEVNSLGYSPDLLWQWFDAAGYGIVIPDRLAHDAPDAGREVFLDAHSYPRRTLNFFAVARDRRQELRDKARAILGIA